MRDLTSHPWAGLKVRVILFATDALGQKGRSSVETFLLPERVFNDPTARALIVLRKQLTRDPKAFRLDVADGMRLIQVNPESYRNDPVVQLGLRIGAARLAPERRQADHRRHPEALVGPRDAARAAAPPPTPSGRSSRRARSCATPCSARPATRRSRRLIQQLYSAMDRWQKELAERMKDPEERRRMKEQAEKMDPNNTITGDDLQKMLDKIREMAKNGQREEAKRLLEELRKMMENATPMMAQPGQQRQQRPARPAGTGQPAGPRDDEPARPAVAAPEPASGRERARRPPAAGPPGPAGPAAASRASRVSKASRASKASKASRARASSPATASGASSSAASRKACAASSATS